eukprot:CAMPEP_0119309596 /NCGR_PEP_ID=MMETSP1333-20130426/15856_1 /TAXON_ID=418940 /ORGANISM="Scyphosphaera apsteinii, Strain RCC1455" /LENGTH=162 /DNA_ID=CAMNT_0007313593 /DNA_START=40 /DNA_END=528 /DNA_ORIENTATION=-
MLKLFVAVASGMCYAPWMRQCETDPNNAHLGPGCNCRPQVVGVADSKKVAPFAVEMAREEMAREGPIAWCCSLSCGVEVDKNGVPLLDDNGLSYRQKFCITPFSIDAPKEKEVLTPEEKAGFQAYCGDGCKAMPTGHNSRSLLFGTNEPDDSVKCPTGCIMA